MDPCRSWVTREEFVRRQVRVKPTQTKRQFCVRNVLMITLSPHEWWSTLHSAVFGSSSSLPPLVGGGGGLVCESVGKADLLINQSRESVAAHLIVIIS